MKLKFNSESGMTLIELMFAAGVLAVGLSMLFGSLVSVTAMSRVSDSRTLAAADLNTVMESLQDVSRVSQLATYYPPNLKCLGPLETVSVVLPEIIGDDGMPTPVPVTALPTGMTSLPRPLAVECIISWYTEQRPMHITATKWLTK